MVFSCKKRRRHRRKSSCWRNPFLVFFLSFVAIGSLRFRVRTARVAQGAASKLFRKKHPDSSSSLLNARTTTMIQYSKVEEGTISAGNSYQKYRVERTNGSSSEPISMVQWIEMLAAKAEDSIENVTPRHELLRTLKDSPYQAFFFETPGIVMSDSASTSQPAEFVLVDAPRLDSFATGRPDPSAFRTHLEACSSPACAFANLSGDATLIAPRAQTKTAASYNHNNNKNAMSVYSHLAAFVREASITQQLFTMELAAETYKAALSSNSRNPSAPLYFSTSGLGVAWLHFRIDERPKYYAYPPYKQQYAVGDNSISTI